jgi:hypothetical protein
VRDRDGTGPPEADECGRSADGVPRKFQICGVSDTGNKKFKRRDKYGLGAKIDSGISSGDDEMAPGDLISRIKVV